MKSYIASPIKLDTINQSIKSTLEKIGLRVFLPNSLHEKYGYSIDDAFIGNRCYEEIDSSDLVIVVVPFGLSTAAEIGYSIRHKISGNCKKIILFHSHNGHLEQESMIHPFIDYQVSSLEELECIVRGLLDKHDNVLISSPFNEW